MHAQDLVGGGRARRDRFELGAARSDGVTDGGEALRALGVSARTAVLPIAGVLDDGDAACGEHRAAWYLRGT